MVKMGSFVAGALFSTILSGALQGCMATKLEKPVILTSPPADVAPWIVGAVAGVAGAVAKSEGAKSFALGSFFAGALALTKALSAVIAYSLAKK
jgi:hypothetical protein